VRYLYENSDVEDSGSDSDKSATVYAIIFSVFLVVIAVLALAGVNYIYFFAVIIAGLLPLQALAGMSKPLRAKKSTPEPVELEPGPAVQTKNDAGLDVIKL